MYDMRKQNHTKMLSFRVTSYDFNFIHGLAGLYADGDVSEWLRWGALNAPRKYLKKKAPEPKPQGLKSTKRRKR